MKKLFGMMLLMMISLMVSADELVKFDMNGFTGGKVEKTSEVVVSEEGVDPVMVQVTITVTPDPGYYITKDDIVVMATYTLPPTPTNETRGESEEKEQQMPVFTDRIELVGEDDLQKLTGARDYTFMIEKGFGVWVTEANFKQIVTEGEIGNVKWSLKTVETKGEDPKLILTLEGEGDASIDEGSAPWAVQKSAITSLVISKGITALGAGLLSGCDLLKSVEIQNAESVIVLGEDAIPANEDLTVNVPGNIFNMYQMDDSWKNFNVDSKNAVKMEGVKFVDGKNQYDVFASLDKTLEIPAGVEGYNITGVQGNQILYKKVDKIKKGDVVLLFSKTIKTEDLCTVIDGSETPENNEKSRTRAGEESEEESGEETTEEEEPIIEYALKVVTRDPDKKDEDQGLDVELGQVYMLYNDVFYPTQAGRIPVGGIYLEEVKKDEDAGDNNNKKIRSRLFLNFNGASDDEATGIREKVIVNSDKFAAAWYTLSGRRLNAQPTAKGLYIHAGKKMVIK